MRAATWIVELGVGAACLVLARVLLSARGRRWLVALLAVAGAAAVIHALGALVDLWA